MNARKSLLRVSWERGFGALCLAAVGLALGLALVGTLPAAVGQPPPDRAGSSAPSQPAMLLYLPLVRRNSRYGCGPHEYGAGRERLGVKQSIDGGATWTFRGHACFHEPTLLPVDPSPLPAGDDVALYFLDLLSLQPTRPARVIYRALTGDGLEFAPPVPAYSTATFITDPFVLRLASGAYRMYLHSNQGILSASSSDGKTFVPDEGLRTDVGGVPGALLLPTGEVRLFVCGLEGIISLLSSDGLTFVREPGVRIPVPATGQLVADPHPIHLLSGGYLMAYKVIPTGGTTPFDDLTFLATSADGLSWTPGAQPVARGSVPGLIERTDGSLLLYYVDMNY